MTSEFLLAPIFGTPNSLICTSHPPFLSLNDLGSILLSYRQELYLRAEDNFTYLFGQGVLGAWEGWVCWNEGMQGG